jgi:hypothetical protein
MSLGRGSAAATALAVAALVAAVGSGLSSARAAAGGSGSVAAAQTSGTPLVAYLRYTATSPSTIWITRPTGGPQRRLGRGEQPLISPDGGYYVAATAVNSNGPALLIYSTEGGSPRSFFSSAQANATPAAWSANGRYLAVALLGTSVNSARGSGLAVIDTQTWTTKIVASGIIYGASFNPIEPPNDPTAAPQLVYASAPSLLGSAPSNLRTVGVDGGESTMLTHDGHSLNPVWGARGIVFDRERMRKGVAQAPEYQVWLMAGSHLQHQQQLTSLKVPSLDDGLVPLAVSADGNRIIATFGGEDTSYAWRIQITPRQVAPVTIGHQYVQAAGISLDGTRLLVDVGDFEQMSSRGSVDTVAFGGGDVVKVARGADGSWNG